MYLQNVFVAIEEQKANETNYSLYYKFVLRQQVINAHNSQEKGSTSGGGVDASSEGLDVGVGAISSEEKKIVDELPLTQGDLQKYKKGIADQM